MSWSAFRNARRQAEQLAPTTAYDPWEAEIYKIAAGERGMVRVLAPANDELLVLKRHWLPGAGPRTCTSEWPGFEGHCVYCHYLHQAQQARNAGGSLTEQQQKDIDKLYPRLVYAIEVIDLRFYHRVKGSDGKIAFERCMSDEILPQRNRCRFCNSHDPSVAERFMGGHKVWEMGKTHFQQLYAVNDILGQTCLHYDQATGQVCGQDVFPVEFVCPHCQMHAWFEEHHLQTEPPEKILEFIEQEHECPKCGKRGYPKEIQMCASEAHDPVPATVFDKTLEVNCAGEVKTDRSGRQRKYTTLNFDRSQPFSNIQNDLQGYGLDDAELKALLQHWDLHHRFRPERVDRSKFSSDAEYVAAVLDVQAKQLKRPNPYQAQTQTRSAPWGGGGGQRQFRRPQ